MDLSILRSYYETPTGWLLRYSPESVKLGAASLSVICTGYQVSGAGYMRNRVRVCACICLYPYYYYGNYWQCANDEQCQSTNYATNSTPWSTIQQKRQAERGCAYPSPYYPSFANRRSSRSTRLEHGLCTYERRRLSLVRLVEIFFFVTADQGGVRDKLRRDWCLNTTCRQVKGNNTPPRQAGSPATLPGRRGIAV